MTKKFRRHYQHPIEAMLLRDGADLQIVFPGSVSRNRAAGSRRQWRRPNFWSRVPPVIRFLSATSIGRNRPMDFETQKKRIFATIARSLLRLGSGLIYERAIKSVTSCEKGLTPTERTYPPSRPEATTTSRNFPAPQSRVLLSLRKLLPSHFARPLSFRTSSVRISESFVSIQRFAVWILHICTWQHFLSEK